MFLRLFFVIGAFLVISSSLLAEESLGKLVFSDDFERNESQEEQEELTNGWASNSGKRANGNKQVDLRDGAMHIYFHESADHAVSVTHPAEFTDGAVQMRFRLDHPKDNIGLNFADLSHKGIWAGHLFIARIHSDKVEIQDLKTGTMNLEIRQARQDKTLTAEQNQLLKTKKAKFAHKLELGKWHSLLVYIKGDQLSITINGQEVGSFQSEGVAHPTKKMLRLSVPRQAIVDDIKIWRRK